MEIQRIRMIADFHVFLLNEKHCYFLDSFMVITIEQVEYIARLARLEFSDAEKETLSEELSQILQYMEKLNELDTEGVEPLSHPTELVNIMRPDEVQSSFTPKEALENAPSQHNGFFKVPKVIK